jgi:hypothetical protein
VAAGLYILEGHGMRRFCATFCGLVLIVCAFSLDAKATEMYFQPDTTYAQIGDTILFTAYITASETVRSFTVYMTYDTNDVDLAVAPTPGSLIAGLPGLDFRYADHIIAAPEWLEVGATVFGTTYWAGPGAVFQFGLVMRECGDIPMTGSFGLRRPDGSFIAGTFTAPRLFTCDPQPENPDSLTIFWTGTDALLKWTPVSLSTFGYPLPSAPSYIIYRREELPTQTPYAPIDTTTATTYLDVAPPGDKHMYYIKAEIIE